MMITKLRGDITVGVVLAELLRAGFSALLPVGENHRYDLVSEKAGVFTRIQCKTGALRNGCVNFSVASTNVIKKQWVRRNYRGDTDLFGVFCPDTGAVYFVPVEDMGISGGRLRVTPLARRTGKKTSPPASKYLSSVVFPM